MIVTIQGKFFQEVISLIDLGIRSLGSNNREFQESLYLLLRFQHPIPFTTNERCL